MDTACFNNAALYLRTSPVLFVSRNWWTLVFKAQYRPFDAELAMLQEYILLKEVFHNKRPAIAYGGDTNKYLSDVQRWLKQIDQLFWKPLY